MTPEVPAVICPTKMVICAFAVTVAVALAICAGGAACAEVPVQCCSSSVPWPIHYHPFLIVYMITCWGVNGGSGVIAGVVGIVGVVVSVVGGLSTKASSTILANFCIDPLSELCHFRINTRQTIL